MKKPTSERLCWRMTQRVKCPGEGKGTFLCHHARPGWRSRRMVGAMPCARPVTGPIQLALSFANRVLKGQGKGPSTLAKAASSIGGCYWLFMSC